MVSCLISTIDKHEAACGRMLYLQIPSDFLLPPENNVQTLLFTPALLNRTLLEEFCVNELLLLGRNKLFYSWDVTIFSVRSVSDP